MLAPSVTQEARREDHLIDLLERLNGRDIEHLPDAPGMTQKKKVLLVTRQSGRGGGNRESLLFLLGGWLGGWEADFFELWWPRLTRIPLPAN